MKEIKEKVIKQTKNGGDVIPKGNSNVQHIQTNYLIFQKVRYTNIAGK